MKRTLAVVGAAVIAVVGAAAASQAQGRPNAQGPGQARDRFECGPPRGNDGPGQGAVRGRGPGGARRGGIGRPGGPGRMGGRGNPLCGLDLTAEQQAQVAAIHQRSRSEIDAVLTPEQKEKLRARRGGR